MSGMTPALSWYYNTEGGRIGAGWMMMFSDGLRLGDSVTPRTGVPKTGGTFGTLMTGGGISGGNILIGLTEEDRD